MESKDPGFNQKPVHLHRSRTSLSSSSKSSHDPYLTAAMRGLRACLLEGLAMCSEVERGQLYSHGDLGSALGIAIGQVSPLHDACQFAKRRQRDPLFGCCELEQSVSSVIVNAQQWWQPVLRLRGDVSGRILQGGN